jgi:LysR family transcriptional regulator, glycine cleavage system transcriptional activator
LGAVGLVGLEPAGSRVFDTVPAALEAAALGQGVLLGLDPLVWDTPQAARLTVPFSTPPVSAGSYFLVHRRADRARPAVEAFTTWIRREAATDLTRLRKLAAERLARPASGTP